MLYYYNNEDPKNREKLSGTAYQLTKQGTLVPERRKTNNMSPMTVPADCPDRFSRLRCKEGESKQSQAVTSSWGKTHGVWSGQELEFKKQSPGEKTAVQKNSCGDPQGIRPQGFICSSICLQRSYLRKRKEPLKRNWYSELRQVQE